MTDTPATQPTPQNTPKQSAEMQKLPKHLRWNGDGPAPASWYVGNTKVYRSYEDYCYD